MDLELKGKVAVVGGATSGLGLAIARALSAEGAEVVMVGRRAELLRTEAERIGGHPFTGDLSRREDRARLIESTVERFGGLDILVWNTGGPAGGPAAGMAAEQARATFDSLVVPLVDLVERALPHLRASTAGRILAVTTGGVKEPTAGMGLSNAIRPGIAGYLKTLSTELAPEGITVNNLAPGRILTQRFDDIFPDGPPAGLEEEIPLGRFGRPEEIGAAAAFLASACAAYITGVTLVIDGGLAKGIF
ncbi:SDR family oxidoreductase [Amycolatopsis pithecellobii]|uniref:SDR family oxidoreductase n=1 Tax=Amycolatopsis pithecellobii TaxID=664692 RepID=A0A6N7YTT8_9PSEU|nr:SDR family oxidoreductase [Amycolatopsis pithecellobii]MTD56457.1 SDR family oxidoreductase [Amycolatopsis pithecellobii]